MLIENGHDKKFIDPNLSFNFILSVLDKSIITSILYSGFSLANAFQLITFVN